MVVTRARVAVVVAALVALVVGSSRPARADRERAQVRFAAPRVTGPAGRVVVERMLRRHQAQFAYCYERARQRKPELAGRLRLRFRVLASGSTEGSATGLDDELENCAARIVGRLRFPAGAGDSDVRVDLVVRPPRPAPVRAGSPLSSPCVACALGACPCPCACPCDAGGLRPGLGECPPGARLGGQHPGSDVRSGAFRAAHPVRRSE